MTVESTIIPKTSDADNVTLEKSNNVLQIKGTYEAQSIIQPIAENQIEIVELLANASLTGMTHDSIISDTFSDSNGYKNSVSSALAAYDSSAKKYKRVNVSSPDAHGVTLGAPDGGNTADEGMRVTPYVTMTLTKVTKKSTCTATTCKLKDNAGTLIESVSFVGNDATFSQVLTGGTSYRIEVTGAGYDRPYSGTGQAPKSGTLVTWNAYSYNGADSGSAPSIFMNLESISGTVSSSNQSVTLSLGTITGTVIATELVCSCPDRETGDSVTYSITDGSHTDSGLALNTKNNLTLVTANPTAITISLTGKSSSPTTGIPSLKSYCLKVFKS